MSRGLWALVALVAALRLGLAFALPLTGDEAYYWEWSLRPAFGYVDHPPAVAWTIAAFAFLGRSPGCIRFGFWLCGVVATAALADAARRVVRARYPEDPARAGRAAALAALLLAIAPLLSLAFATASPDGPYLAAWAVALDFACALEAGAAGGAAFDLAFGAALAAALMARAFAGALLIGLAAAAPRPRRLPPIFAATLALCVPYLVWNAQHGWANVAFTVVGRHVNEGFSPLRPLATLALLTLALGPGSLVAALLATRRDAPRAALVSAAALSAVVLVAALLERVELYWFFGPYLSLGLIAAVAWSGAPRGPARRRLTVACGVSAALTLATLATALAPFAVMGALTRAFHLRLRNASLFEIYTYAPLARDVARLATRERAAVMTDGYGLSALLDYEAGVRPIVGGYTWQGREARRFVPDATRLGRVAFLDKIDLAERPDLARQLARACTRVTPGPRLTYPLAGVPARVYFVTWCQRLRPDGLAIMRWER